MYQILGNNYCQEFNQFRAQLSALKVSICFGMYYNYQHKERDSITLGTIVLGNPESVNESVRKKALSSNLYNNKVQNTTGNQNSK